MGEDNAHYDDPYVQETHSRLIVASLCNTRRKDSGRKRVQTGGGRGGGGGGAEAG